MLLSAWPAEHHSIPEAKIKMLFIVSSETSFLKAHCLVTIRLLSADTCTGIVAACALFFSTCFYIIKSQA